jgi:hypothetical protein
LLGTARRRWKWREEVSGEQRVTAAYNLVRARKLLAEEIVPTNQCFRNALNVLSAAEGKLKRATIKESAVKPELDKQLERCASMLEKSRIALEQRRKSYWENSLFAEPAEKMTWMIELDDKNRVHSIPPKELAEHERIFEKAKYLRQLVKRIDLDARFQVRVAVILRSYLSRDYISLITISRLTLLTYICGNLGKMHDGKLIVDGREITVLAVDQKIRDAHLK